MRPKDLLTDIIIAFSAAGITLYCIIRSVGDIDAVAYVIRAALRGV